ncbi:ATP-binding protein, partial [Escherichia sp. TWPC-MK]
RDGFVFTFPIIMASSLIILINFAILSPDGFIAGLLHLNSIFPNLEKAQAIFTPVMNGSVNIMSIMIAFLVARNMAISYEQDDLLCGLTAIGAFFIVYTPYQMIDGQAFLTTKYLGAQGLFDRFYRVDPSRQRKGEGSGIGLAIVKSIVVAHKGTVAVTSDARGTRFVIMLPERE